MSHRASQGWTVLLGLLIIVNGILLLQGPLGPSYAAKPVQYKVIDVLPDTREMQIVLDDYGSAGWELIAVGMGDLLRPRLFFKKVPRE